MYAFGRAGQSVRRARRMLVIPGQPAMPSGSGKGDPVMPYKHAPYYVLAVIAVIVAGFWPSYFGAWGAAALAIPRPRHRRQHLGADGPHPELDGAQGAAAAAPRGRQVEPAAVPLPDRRAGGDHRPHRQRLRRSVGPGSNDVRKRIPDRPGARHRRLCRPLLPRAQISPEGVGRIRAICWRPR